MNNVAEIYLWGTRIGIVYLEEGKQYVSYEYDSGFVHSGVEVSPISMPLSNRVYEFPNLEKTAFHGVPGLLSDSLPDKFGNAVINQWLASQGRSPESFHVVERLCYTGARGMGALEYVPANGPGDSMEESVNISEMVKFASEILKNREKIHLSLTENITYKQLLKLGTSAGGARAKAIIAWNEKTGDIRSGQVKAGDGYGYWLLKFDGISSNGDHGLQDEPEYTLIEYAYYLMANAAGIDMNECRILKENGRNHFITKRFDRAEETGEKIHMQTLGAIAHIDYNIPGLCSYEQAAMYARQMGLTAKDIEQLYRRMVFNVLAVNQDDHVKNISFLMNRDGIWRLSPAYDITFSYDSSNKWLSAHQMLVNGKKTQITKDDLLITGQKMDIQKRKCKKIMEEVQNAVKKWAEFAERAGIREATMSMIQHIMKQENGESAIFE